MSMLISAQKCPKCGALYYLIPDCQNCGWIEPGWKKWVEEQQRLWDKHKDEVIKVIRLPIKR